MRVTKIARVVLGMAALLAAEKTFAAGAQGGGSERKAPGYTGSLPYVEFEWHSGMGAPKDLQMVADALNDYVGPRINARVNLYFDGTDALAKLTPALQAGQDVGIVTYMGFNYPLLAKSGSYKAIEGLLDKNAPMTKALFKPAVWDVMNVDGHVYGIPALKSNVNQISFIYNDTLARKLGIDMTKSPYKTGETWKLEPWLNEVKAKRDAVIGDAPEPLLGAYANNVWEYNFLMDYLWPQYFAVFNIEGLASYGGYDQYTAYNLYETEEFRDYARAMWRMANKNILPHDPQGAQTNWNSSSIATKANLFARVGTEVYLDEHVYGDDISVKIQLPEKTWGSTSRILAAGVALAANTKNAERELQLLELVYNDPKVATLLRFGIEGQHYLRDSHGAMTLEGSPRNGDPKSRGYVVWYGADLGNMFIVDAPESYSGPGNFMIKKWAEFDQNQLPPAYLGFVPDIDPIRNEMAACTNVVAEYDETIRFGLAPTEADVDRVIDEFTAKLRANGAQKILAEVQKQADAFRTRKK